MSNATLTFTLPEETEEFETAVNGGAYKSALWDISQDVFRPARKHGYSNQKIQDLVNKLDTLVRKDLGVTDESQMQGFGYEDDCTATDLIGLLEKEFYSILQSHGVNLN